MKLDVNDLVGKQINQLTVLVYVGAIDDKYHAYLCRCSCGLELIVRRQRLKSAKKNQVSCGCAKRAAVAPTHRALGWQ
jgi:hypothetical protein